MPIIIEVNQVGLPQSKRFLKRWLAGIIQATLKGIKVSQADISLALVNPAVMTKLNLAYRGKNKVTDVLSFALSSPADKNNFVGEIIICPQQAKKQAPLFHQTYKSEIARLIIHGTLHLFGYNHTRPRAAKKMLVLTQRILPAVV